MMCACEWNFTCLRCADEDRDGTRTVDARTEEASEREETLGHPLASNLERGQ